MSNSAAVAHVPAGAAPRCRRSARSQAEPERSLGEDHAASLGLLRVVRKIPRSGDGTLGRIARSFVLEGGNGMAPNDRHAATTTGWRGRAESWFRTSAALVDELW